MLERDLERATIINIEIGQINECIATHREFGRHLQLRFWLPREVKVNGEVKTTWDEASVAFALQLNEDEIHAKANIILNEMLQEKLKAKRLELKKLGIKLEDESIALPKGKKEPLKLSGPSGNGK